MGEYAVKLPSNVPALRVRVLNRNPIEHQRPFVLYWMTHARRTQYNYALQRARDWAKHLCKPLVVLEILACGDSKDSERHHRFVLDGMAANQQSLTSHSVFYYPFVERRPGETYELLKAVALQSCVLLADDYPIFTPGDIRGDPPVFVEFVDSNGLLPMQAVEAVFSTAHAFRRFWQKILPDHLLDIAEQNPLARIKLPQLTRLPQEIASRWPAAGRRILEGSSAELAKLPIVHGIEPTGLQGGSDAARAVLYRFLKDRLPRYVADRLNVYQESCSGLSPYLHFGHIAAQDVFCALATAEKWSPAQLSERATGKREGWWAMSEPAEAFLDELVTWREIGFNFCSKRTDFAAYESLPDWAQKTLAKHRRDIREHVYSIDELKGAETHDPLWNAAQKQLLREGRIHNYWRMLWGKKILQWTPSPQDALAMMIDLNDQFALDGRDPNSYSGILWVLGRYDRAWGPERPIFGTIRYMSSQATARKTHWRDPENV